MRGRRIAETDNAEAWNNTPVFCEACLDHQLTELKREAVKSARRKRKGEHAEVAETAMERRMQVKRKCDEERNSGS